MSSARERIIETASQLIESQGYHATGMNQIIQESGAPKGSLYYYFPEGKEALAAEAVEHTGRIVEGRIRASLDTVADPAEAVRRFVLTIAGYVAASEYRAGGPVTTVALESATSSERINAVCRAIYDAWQDAFRARLERGGMAPDRAASCAALIVSALEGGIVLSRTAHSTEPLRRVAEELATLIRAARA